MILGKSQVYKVVSAGILKISRITVVAFKNLINSIIYEVSKMRWDNDEGLDEPGNDEVRQVRAHDESGGGEIGSQQTPPLGAFVVDGARA